MEAAVISGLVGALTGNLILSIRQEIALSTNCEKEKRKIESTLLAIKNVLLDAEEQQEWTKADRDWLAKLKKAAYDAEDKLQEFAAEALLRKQSIQVLTFSLLPFVFQLRMGHGMKKIREKFDDIAAERLKFHPKNQSSISETPQRCSYLDESRIYGRRDDKRKVLKLLLEEGCSEKNCMIIPIVGIGGIGKTTFSQWICDDQSVKDHFNLRMMWTSTRENLDEIKLMRAILESITKNDCTLQNPHLIKNDLKMMLPKNRFLFVLDNVWGINSDWDDFKAEVLNRGQKGSKVLVTTRSKQVGSGMGDIAPYLLEGLTDKDCWALFEQNAFVLGSAESERFKAIGRNIARKCRGVPLAAKALGRIMRFKREEGQWLSIQNSNLRSIEEHEHVILPVLRLSYNHLSLHSKLCFAFCAVFPRSYEIDKDELILYWLAQGLIPNKGNMSLEDAAIDVINELLSVSFFEVVKNDEDRKVMKIKMHELIHDLAQDIQGNECADQNDTINEGIRHVALDGRQRLRAPPGLHEARSLRTFYLLLDREGTRSIDYDFTNFRFLRMLGLRHSGIENLPSSITNLKLLKYLDLSYTHITTLPESLSKLLNLQTLLLKGCRSLLGLPKRISNITSLRCLDIDGCETLTHMPDHVGKLTGLQWLTGFVVGMVGASVGELKDLDLSGQLHIKQLENVKSPADALEADLKSKPNLHSLRLSWKENHPAGMPQNHVDVLDALKPNQRLKRLYLANYKGAEFPSWMKSLSNSSLVEISLVGCVSVENLPELGTLPHLKTLLVERMDSLKKIDRRFYCHNASGEVFFQSLTKLTLKELCNLEEWDEMDGEALPHLTELTIVNCPKLSSIPCMSSIQELVLRNSNESLLKVIEGMTSLLSLTIRGFPKLSKLPEGILQKIPQFKVFKIQDCPNLSEALHKNPLLNREGVIVWDSTNLSSVAQGSMLILSSSTS